MEYRMYGWGNDPANVLPNLKARGYHSVSGGYNKETAAICRDLGLSYYLSANGFSDPQVGYTCADGTVLPKEICPCDDVMRQAKLAQMKTLASLDDITGITIDFCRYPSMVDGNIHLFGCFCETCMARMEAADFDAVRIRAAVLALQRAMTEKTALNPDCDALADWIKWKKQTITAHFCALKDAVRSVSPTLQFGAFTFAPSIAPLVGQDYEALDGILDHISPMLYRHWQHPQGDACLDREIAWLLSCAEAEPSIAEALAACGFDASIYPPSSYVAANGVLVSHMVTETKLARAAVQRAALVPIYLLEDPHIAYTVDAVKHLCDGVDFYVYHETTIDQILVR